jgi:hypothetical protein
VTEKEKKIPKLHELLAVEQERKAEVDRVRRDTAVTFEKKQTHFSGMRRTFRPFSVDEPRGESAGERLEAETRLVTTVHETLEAALRTVGQSLDLSYQVDEANTRARADIIVDDEVLAADVPATFLLQLEKRLRDVRSLAEHVPTFDPVRLWQPDPGADHKHVLRAEPVITIRKQRTRKYNVMYEATKEHPAQIDVVEVEEPVGELRAYDWTGMVSPRQKAELLEQVDKLMAAVKRARARANAANVDTSRRVALPILDFIMRPLKGS